MSISSHPSPRESGIIVGLWWDCLGFFYFRGSRISQPVSDPCPRADATLQGMPGQRAGGWSSYRIMSVSAKVGGLGLVHPESRWYRYYLLLTTTTVIRRYPLGSGLGGRLCATWKQGTRVAGRLLGVYLQHNIGIGNGMGMYWVLPESQHYRAALIWPSQPPSQIRCFHVAQSPGWPGSGAGTSAKRPCSRSPTP